MEVQEGLGGWEVVGEGWWGRERVEEGGGGLEVSVTIPRRT